MVGSSAVERETIPMEGPVYQVHFPGVGPLWFPEDDYRGAFQHATGQRIAEAGDDHEQEADITLVDFDGVVEVPVANV